MEPRKTKEPRPFYKPPEDKPTSAEIVKDARSSLQAVRTTRPFTPREEHRSLFGVTSIRNPESRPPILVPPNYDSESRPVSGTRLTPLEHAHPPKQVSDLETENVILPPKPPTSDQHKSQKRKPSRTRLHHANSVDHNTYELVKSKSGSLSDIYTVSKDPEPTSPESPRRTHSGPKERTPLTTESAESGSSVPRRSRSGPKERTPLPVEERGVGDGKEMPPRAPSSLTVRSPPSSTGSKSNSILPNETNVLKRTPAAGSTGKHSSSTDKQEDTQLYDEHIAPMLLEMKALARNKEVTSLSELLENLYRLLEKENLLGKNCKQRAQILKVVFKVLDIDDARLMLKLARLILAFKVSGNNLLNVCRLVFKVSRNEKNDSYFMDDKVVDLLLETLKSTDHVAGYEALIYCVGTFKFLTGNTTICKRLVKKCCIENLAQLLNNINRTNRENGKSSDQMGHILVQLTAALRNLADTNMSRERFLSCRVVESLSCVMDSHATDADIVLNVSRIFSKMTLHTDCCIALGEQTKSYRTFLDLLGRHQQKEDIVVRVCFILGNMTAKNDDARVRLFQETNCMSVLLSVLKKYCDMDGKSKSKESKPNPPNPETCVRDTRPDNKSEDVLIKVVRVIANLCINDTVGPVVASNQSCLELLLNVLDNKAINASEELVLNTVATINNMSYYSVKNSAIFALESRVLESLLKLVLTDDMEAMVETARVFGNLTRQKSVRNFLAQKKVDRMMITLLDSGNREVVYIACGVLINFMVDEEKRATLKDEGGIKKVKVLRDFARTDWVLASMVCQTLWNYSGKITSTELCFGVSETGELADLLIEYLDQEAALDISEENGMEEEVRQYLQETWQTDFIPVAKSLLTRLETHQSDLEPLQSPRG
ncbi:hypothetical protein ScPMuIL_011808 [Solemya velum]